MFRKPHQEQFEAVRKYVESYIENRIKGQSRAYRATAPDIAEQLTKLAVLRDQGILTSDEFDDQKAKLLRG